jgi:hypothetical protein
MPLKRVKTATKAGYCRPEYQYRTNAKKCVVGPILKIGKFTQQTTKPDQVQNPIRQTKMNVSTY